LGAYALAPAMYPFNGARVHTLRSASYRKMSVRLLACWTGGIDDTHINHIFASLKQFRKKRRKTLSQSSTRKSSAAAEWRNPSELEYILIFVMQGLAGGKLPPLFPAKKNQGARPWKTEGV
jgi:hypothetical protein